MDVEGKEYLVFNSVSDATLQKIDQIVIEFHHHCVDCLSVALTCNIIQILEAAGFTPYTTDYLNYLFFRKTLRFKA